MTVDLLKLGIILWPEVRFFDKQQEMIYSVEHNVETVVHAGNMLGKDYVAAFIALTTFLRATLILKKSCRVVTTSVKDDHLRVLWGEISRYVLSSQIPLTKDKRGPLLFNHRDIRLVSEGVNGYSYIRGMVSERGEGMSGHHADITLGVIDEASGVDDNVYHHMCEWSKQRLIFGNPNPTTNFFYQAVKGGDILMA